MKSWTVMLIPQGQGNTRSLNFTTFHLWVVVSALSIIAFTTAFYYQRSEALATQLREAQADPVVFERAAGTAPIVTTEAGERDEAEVTTDPARNQYESALTVLGAELDAVYEFEAEVRERLKLEPRKKAPTGFVTQARGDEDGRGGPPGSSPMYNTEPGGMSTLPFSLIQGIANRSADLLQAEMGFRRESLADMILQIEELRVEKEAEDKLAFMPTSRPTNHPRAKISSRFGNRRDPFSRQLRHHDGIDFAAPYGTPVLATADGTVVKAGWTRYFGNMVEIQHQDGLSTLYAHMSKLQVKKGAKVTKGQTIGAVGSTGRSTGPHIHYEIHLNGRPVNPSKYLVK